MALRAAHGRSAEFSDAPHIEALPGDELPAPVPAPRGTPAVPVRRGEGRRFTAGSEQARAAGKASALARVAMRSGIPLATVGAGIADHPDFAPYRRRAAGLRRAYCSELAEFAGGTCGAGPSRMVAAGSLEYAIGQFLIDRGAKTLDAADWQLAAKINMAGRQHFAMAYELAVRQAQLRGVGEDLPDVDEVTRRAEARAAERRRPARVIDSPAG